MFGVTVPAYRWSAVLFVDRPTEKWVMVSDPPVACGKEMVVVGCTEDPETVQPELDRSTATRAYEV
jgi:hypothetical protein